MFYFSFNNFEKTNRQNREAMDWLIIKMGNMLVTGKKIKNVWNLFVFV